MPYLRAAGLVLALAATFLVVAPVQALARRRGWALRHRLQTGFCRVVLVLLGIRVRAEGRLAGPGPRLVVANHVSWTDILVLASLHPLVFLAKREVANWPVLGWLARLQGTVFVARDSRRGVAKVNAALAEVLRGGADVVVFAEGTSSDGAAVLPFSPTHFAALADAATSVTLAPVGIAYTPDDVGWYGDMTFLPHLWRLLRRDGVRCHVRFGAAVATEGRDRKALAAATEASVRDLVQAARLSDDAAPPKKST
jgi:1-acyl-sn-glycerol-3-phosphate acyltransferase